MEHRNLKDNALSEHRLGRQRERQGCLLLWQMLSLCAPIKHLEAAAGRDILRFILTENGGFVRQKR